MAVEKLARWTPRTSQKELTAKNVKPKIVTTKLLKLKNPDKCLYFYSYSSVQQSLPFKSFNGHFLVETAAREVDFGMYSSFALGHNTTEHCQKLCGLWKNKQVLRDSRQTMHLCD